MKRIHSAALIAALPAVLLSGCGQRTARNTTTGPKAESSTAARAAKPEAATSKPKTETAVQRLPMKPTAKDILLGTAEVYKSARTLKISGNTSQSVQMGDKRNSGQAQLTVQFQRPNKRRIQFGQGKQYVLIVSDGSKESFYDSKAKMYRTGPAPKDINKAAMDGTPGISTMMLIGGMNVSPFLKTAKLVGSEKVAGVDSYVILLPLPTPGMTGATAKQRLWIGKKDLLIRQMETVTSASANALSAHMSGKRKPKGAFVATEKAVMTSVAINVPIPSSAFRFTPPAGAKAFKPQLPAGHPKVPSPPQTTGEKAPDFSMPSLTGDQISLASYKGKPLLVIFWTSLSDNAKQGMAIVQSMQDQFKTRGVSTVAITLDSNKAAAEKFVKDNGISFPVLMDYPTAVKTANAFGFRDLPTVYVIDGKGIVRGKAIGAAPADIWAGLAGAGVK